MANAASTGRFDRLLKGLSRTRQGFVSRLRQLARREKSLDAESLEEIEELLISADCGVAVTEAVISGLRQRGPGGHLAGENGLEALLREELMASFPESSCVEMASPHVLVAVGVNGSGKTTTLGKLAARARARGQRVLLVAADTYRAAAVEQLQIWGRRSQVPVVAQRSGADPAAVVVDALRAAVARGVDLVLVDTAGRLHTRAPLMRELEKIGRVAGREIPQAPHEVLLVLDACTGQNGLEQARQFTAALPLTALALTKLDGTARGGVAVALSRELGLPIRYVGVGEAVDDLLDFSAAEFVSGLLHGMDPS